MVVSLWRRNGRERSAGVCGGAGGSGRARLRAKAQSAIERQGFGRLQARLRRHRRGARAVGGGAVRGHGRRTRRTARQGWGVGGVMMNAKECYRTEIEEVIAKAKATHSRESLAVAGGAEIYAYPHKDGIAWGVNGAQGVNVWRSIRQPDGAGIAEG